MSDNMNTKCPYCGSSLLQEEDGYRCRFCKSFFPFEAEEGIEQEGRKQLSELTPQIVDPAEEEEKVKAEKAAKFRRAGFELIGLAPAFVSAGFFMFTKTLKMPILMVPGFVLWAFAAGYTVFQFVKSKKNKTEQKPAILRTILLLILAILVLLFMKPSS